MEDSHSQEKSSPEQRTEAFAPLDEVDYKRLARLTAQISSPKDTAGARPLATSAGAHKPPVLPFVLIGSSLIGIILLGLVYWLTNSPSSSPSEVREDSTTNSPINQQEAPNRTTIKPEMVAIPGGTFQMGRSDGPAQEAPPHTVTVNSFYMDKWEVTNAEYADFLRDTAHTAPPHFVNRNPVAGQEQWPVANISIEDIEAFAAWRSKRDGVTYRLPTEEEWEYAARNGDQNSLYPWGNSWEPNRAVTKDAAPTSLKPVGSMPDGKNKWGVVDLIGNVWEWTSSKASVYTGSKMELQPEHRDWHIIRGGSMASEPKGDKPISSAFRDWLKPTETDYRLGFRLARSGDK